MNLHYFSSPVKRLNFYNQCGMHLTAQMVVVYAVCASYSVTFKVLKTITSQVYMRLVIFYIYF